MSDHIYLYRKDSGGIKKTVYPVTDVSAIIGLGNTKGELLNRIQELEKRVSNLEKRVHYY